MDKKFRRLDHHELKSEILKVIKPEVQIDGLDNLFHNLFGEETEPDINQNLTVQVSADCGTGSPGDTCHPGHWQDSG